MTRRERLVSQARLQRLASARAKDLNRCIDMEKESWEEAIEDVRFGRPRLIGDKNPVLMINFPELEALVADLQKPETWGEYFPPSPHQVAKDGVVLEVPRSTNISRAEYKIDTDDDE